MKKDSIKMLQQNRDSLEQVLCVSVINRLLSYTCAKTLNKVAARLLLLLLLLLPLPKAGCM